MPGAVYHPFGPGDLLNTVIHAHPSARFTSGSSGWSGSVGTSSSLSLYEGVRGRPDVRSGMLGTSGIELYPLDPKDTRSIDSVIFVSGSYPSTGSVSYVTARNFPLPLTIDPFFHPHLITEKDWYEEHFRPMLLLYDYYSSIDAGYSTGSWDYYCLRFKQNLTGSASAVVFASASLPTVSSSFLVEARVRPLVVTGSHDLVVLSQAARWKMFVDKTSGRLSFWDGVVTLTSSVIPTRARWQHVAFQADGVTGRFYSSGLLANSFPYTGSLSSSSVPLVLGALSSSSGLSDGFDGFMYESRVWSVTRTSAQVSASSFTTLVDRPSSLVHYARCNDGALAGDHGFSQGSGVLDHSSYANDGRMLNFGTVLPLTPTWHLNDDLTFFPSRAKTADQVDRFRVVSVPSMFYGRQIATGSVRLECKAYDAQGIDRVLLDDGRGSLYVSGSVVRSLGGEDGPGVRWNKAGNVFYVEGLIVITDASLLDFGRTDADTITPSATLSVSFRGVNRIPSKVLLCRLGAAEGNASSNPTYSSLDDRGDDDPTNDRFIMNQDEATTYVTAVGVYNERHELVAVAKMAQAIRKREKDRVMLKLRLDF